MKSRWGSGDERNEKDKGIMVKKRMSTEKGIGKRSMLFTIDSIFALVIALVILLSVIFTLKSLDIKSWTETNINELGMDYLTVLEHSGELKNAVITSDTGEIKEFLNRIVKQNICGKIKIFDQNDNLLIIETKTGCLDSHESYMTKRSFVAEDNFYYAVFEGWYNE